MTSFEEIPLPEGFKYIPPNYDIVNQAIIRNGLLDELQQRSGLKPQDFIFKCFGTGPSNLQIEEQLKEWNGTNKSLQDQLKLQAEESERQHEVSMAWLKQEKDAAIAKLQQEVELLKVHHDEEINTRKQGHNDEEASLLNWQQEKAAIEEQNKYENCAFLDNSK